LGFRPVVSLNKKRIKIERKRGAVIVLACIITAGITLHLGERGTRVTVCSKSVSSKSKKK
jgi:hypothetical protein